MVKKIKYKKFIILGLSIIVIICSGVIYAMHTARVTNHFVMGYVDISLTEYQNNENNGEEELEYSWNNIQIVLPGDRLSRIPRIESSGADCYVRAKIEFDGTSYDMEKTLFGIPDTWTKCSDGYYYFTETLESGGYVDFFQGMQIPIDFPQTEENRSITYKIDVEAVQSRNFSPDFTSNSPWGAVEVIKFEKEGNIKVMEAVDTQTLKVEWLGDTKNLIATPDDFFTNFPAVLPGDTYSDSIVLLNDSDNPVKIYFRSEADRKDDILDKIQLVITSEIGGRSETVYEGSLRRNAENLLLGTISPDTEGMLTFTISVPSELDNDYALIDSYVNWYFSTEEISDDAITSVQTGDHINTSIWIAVSAFSLAVTVIVILLRKKTGGKTG